VDFLYDFVGMEETAACRTDVSKVVTASSRSLIIRDEGMEGMGRSIVVRQRDHFECL